MRFPFFTPGSGFTAVEALLASTMVLLLVGFGIPIYRNYQMKTDLQLAVKQAESGVHRAQSLSQAGSAEDTWGYYAPEAVVFQGESFATRNPEYDEVLPLPPSVAVYGLQEVTFSRVYGMPDRTGDIVFESLNGELAYVTVSDQYALAAPNIPVFSSTSSSTSSSSSEVSSVSSVLSSQASSLSSDSSSEASAEQSSSSSSLSSSYSSALPADVDLLITFDRIQNIWGGDATDTLYVGSPAEEYEAGARIPLRRNGEAVIDDAYHPDSLGLAIHRQEEFVRIALFGGHKWFGKEIVDATIRLDGAIIQEAVSDGGSYVVENPYDGTVHDGPAGDEVTIDGENLSVFFQTRVTNAHDAILIYWNQGNP